jgi:hypothetical protein
MVDPQSPKKRGVQGRGAIVHVFVLVAGIALYLLIGLALWWALNRYIDPQTATQKRDVVQILAVIMAGVAAAVGIYFTWRGQDITKEGQEISRENIETTRQTAEEQLRLTREGQFTERFPRALEQLGATDDSGGIRLEIRLGAIYEFEQIARLSRDHHWPIMEILTTYIRNNAPRRAHEDTLEGRGSIQADIQAILTVIGRRSAYHRDLELARIDLRDTHLRWADLRGADLERARFHGADLRGALLRGARLRGADLKRANLERARLEGADLEGADLRGADLEGANLEGARLQVANLQEATLRGTNVTEEQLAATRSLQGTTMPDGSVHP